MNLKQNYKIMDTTPTRYSFNAVQMLDAAMLDANVRRWPNIKPALDECTILAGKALLSIHVVRATGSSTTVSFQTQLQAKNIGRIINS